MKLRQIVAQRWRGIPIENKVSIAIAIVWLYWNINNLDTTNRNIETIKYNN